MYRYNKEGFGWQSFRCFSQIPLMCRLVYAHPALGYPGVGVYARNNPGTRCGQTHAHSSPDLLGQTRQRVSSQLPATHIPSYTSLSHSSAPFPHLHRVLLTSSLTHPSFSHFLTQIPVLHHLSHPSLSPLLILISIIPLSHPFYDYFLSPSHPYFNPSAPISTPFLFLSHPHFLLILQLSLPSFFTHIPLLHVTHRSLFLPSFSSIFHSFSNLTHPSLFLLPFSPIFHSFSAFLSFSSFFSLSSPYSTPSPTLPPFCLVPFSPLSNPPPQSLPILFIVPFSPIFHSSITPIPISPLFSLRTNRLSHPYSPCFAVFLLIICFFSSCTCITFFLSLS